MIQQIAAAMVAGIVTNGLSAAIVRIVSIIVFSRFLAGLFVATVAGTLEWYTGKRGGVG